MVRAKGLVIRLVPYKVKETIDHLEAVLKKRGATIYARIDQQAEANKIGQDLNPLEFLLFGNPKIGTPLMAENPLVAIDLPVKIICWEDDDKKIWLAYNDPVFIEDRYALSHDTNSPFALDKLMENLFENGLTSL
jgi:uncharacterized protein (DUF302 family)